MFELHPQLKNDTFFIASLKLCDALLMNNALFPWFILVPRVDDVSEIIDLSEADRAVLMKEISTASHVMRAFYTPKKLNVAALGNQVPQLHIHIIGRNESDAAWLHPVWGKGAEPYEKENALSQCRLLRTAFMA